MDVLGPGMTRINARGGEEHVGVVMLTLGAILATLKWPQSAGNGIQGELGIVERTRDRFHHD